MHSLKGLYHTFCYRRRKLKCVFSSLEFQKYWSKFVVLNYIYALKLFLSSVTRVTWIETWKTGPIFSSFNSTLAKISNKLLWLVLPGKFVLYLQNSTGALGSSIKDDGNEDGKKAIGLDWPAKEKLCTCITLFYTFPCCRCMTTVWNCLILRFVVDVNTRQWPSFSFSELSYIPLEFNSRKIRQHLMNRTRWNKRDKV